MDIYLATGSTREFGIFTSKIFGHLIEVSFQDVVLISNVRLQTPILGGVIQIPFAPSPVDGTLNERNVADVAIKLSSGDAKLRVRVID